MKAKIKFIKFKVMIVIEPDGDCFHAYSPPLKGLHVDGKSIDEAKGHARDAAIVYFKSLIKRGDPIPLWGTFVKKKKESKVFYLNVNINLDRSNWVVSGIKSLMKKVVVRLGEWAG